MHTVSVAPRMHAKKGVLAVCLQHAYGDAREVESLERLPDALTARGDLELLPRAAVVRAESAEHQRDRPDGVVRVRVIRVLFGSTLLSVRREALVVSRQILRRLLQPVGSM